MGTFCKMTARQTAKLETVLAKVEALQGEVTDAAVRDDLGDAKAKLLSALRRAATAA